MTFFERYKQNIHWPWPNMLNAPKDGVVTMMQRHMKDGSGMSTHSDFPGAVVMNSSLYDTLMDSHEELKTLLTAVENLLKVKGRCHTQQAYKNLEEIYKNLLTN